MEQLFEKANALNVLGKISSKEDLISKIEEIGYKINIYGEENSLDYRIYHFDSLINETFGCEFEDEEEALEAALETVLHFIQCDTDYEIFERLFNPITDGNNIKLYETYGDDLEYVKTMIERQLVWTIIEADGKLFLSPGFHIVNRLNYIICKNPYDITDQETYRDYAW